MIRSPALIRSLQMCLVQVIWQRSCVGMSVCVCRYECVCVYVCSLQMCLVKVIVYIIRSPVYIIRSPALGTGSCVWYSQLQIVQHLETISETFPTNQNSAHGIYD